jgi:hypothetical protein
MTAAENLRATEVAVLRERLMRAERAIVELAGDLHALSTSGQLRHRGQPSLASLIEAHAAGRLETVDYNAPEERGTIR